MIKKSIEKSIIFEARKTKQYPYIDEENIRWYPLRVQNFNTSKQQSLIKYWKNLESTKTALYINIPFCPYFCNYCVFVKYPPQKSIIERYVNSLLKELLLFEKHIDKFTTIWIGGGTPTILSPKSFQILLEHLSSLISKKTEIVVEAELTTISSKIINTLSNLNVTSISLGVQTFCDEILRILGMRYNSEHVAKKLSELKEFIERFKINPRKKFSKEFNFLKKEKLATIRKGRLVLTPKGMIYINNISKLFFSPKERGRQIIPFIDLRR